MIIAHLGLADWEKSILQNQLSQHQHLFFKTVEDFSVSELNQNLDEIEVLTVFIHNHLSAEILAKMPKLKLIVTRSTGFDHIDLDYAQKHQIPVCNVPSYGENTIAEYSFALLLALARHIPELAYRSGECRFDYEGLRGFDLAGKTIGIIGAGKIGLHANKIAKGFGMKVLVYDVFKNHFLEEVLGFDYTNLNNLLENSDIISVYAPYLPSTHHILNESSFAKMKKGVVIINTSRGQLIDTLALVKNLDNGTVSACGLDVVEDESDLLNCKANPFLEDLVKRKNVIFTPHSGFFTKDAQERILQQTIENITSFTQGKLQNIVK